MKLILYLILLIANQLTLILSKSDFVTCSDNNTCIPLSECVQVMKKYNEISANLKGGSLLKSYVKQVQCGVKDYIPYVCCQRKVNFEEKLPKAPKCGIQFTDRIVGGEDANIDEYPWTVQIYHKYPNGTLDTFCGGVLITNRYVLTAAHCTNLNLVKVRLGDWDTTTNPDCDDDERCNIPFEEIPIQNIIIHDDYNAASRTQCNDIALIKLQQNVSFNEFIKPICLPIDQSVRNLDLTGHHVEVAGFGITNLENRTMSARKKKLGMSVISQKYCEEVYARNDLIINSKQICAGGEEGKDSCNGDSGGPLMKEVTKRDILSHYTLVGLVSFGPKMCGTKDHPAIYTRVSEFMEWIFNNMD